MAGIRITWKKSRVTVAPSTCVASPAFTTARRPVAYSAIASKLRAWSRQS
jgi:hypothetical protein